MTLLDVACPVVALIALAIPSAIFVWCYIDELNRESERYGRWWR